MKRLAARLQTAATVAGGVLLVWLAAPLVALGGAYPLEGVAARVALLIGVALVAVQGWAAAQHLRRRRNARLFEAIQGQDADANDELAARFTAAMKELRAGVPGRSGAPPRWWRRRRQVYQLPWYMFIGAPGAGKTTALLHSGLRFPFAERLGSAPLAGLGGTRQCDWWFTERAVFIDTAGRYTTQDSHRLADAGEWHTFLKLLRRYRPVQPINGVIVTLSVPDLVQGGSDLAQQAAAVDRRLQELREQLGLSFPVYLLVTKMDLLAGFVEFFGDFDASRREQAWGLTFEYPAPAGQALPVDLPGRLRGLAARAAELAPKRLQEEPLAERRAAIYLFAAQVEALLPALEAFARQAFRRAADEPVQHVRGVHLSSGTQEGNPIDRVLGELGRSFGMDMRTPPKRERGGKAFFLASMLQGLVIAEAPLAGTNLRRRRVRRWLLGTGAGLTAAAMLLACTLWWVSYRHNADYADAVRARVDKVVAQIDPGRAGRIDQLLPLYATLEQLAASGDIDPNQTAPWNFGFGLFQGPRLARSAQQTYQRVLDQTLAPLLAERVVDGLRQGNDAAARYEALRIGLMLTTPGRLQRDEVRRWAAQAFAATVGGEPGAASPGSGFGPGAGEQREWLRHLDALLARNAVLDAVQLDPGAVQAARGALLAMPIEARVHERLLRRAAENQPGDRTLADLAGPAAVLAFAPPDAAGLPGLPALYTRQAWREDIEPALDGTIIRLAEEAAWVLGDDTPAVQALVRNRAARDALAQAVARRHALAAAAQWERLLAVLQFHAPGDADSLAHYTRDLAAPGSALRQWLARLASEFAPPAGPASPAAATYAAVIGERFPGLHLYAAGHGAAAVDALLPPFAAALKAPASPAATELGRALRAEATRATPPLRVVWAGLADALSVQQRRALTAQLGSGLAELAQSCRRLTADRFPFVNEASRDMPMADFARVFGPNGLLDAYFRSRLASQVDTRVRPWRLVGEMTLPAKAGATLRSFQMADEIRRLFFPPGAELPELRLQITPVGMDADVLMFSADVDGQMLRYENGPRRTRTLVWPGPAATQRVLLRTLPAGPNGVSAEVHDGPWALLRVMQRRGISRSGGGAALGRMEVDGRSLSLELTASGAGTGAAGLLGELWRFRCPEPW